MCQHEALEYVEKYGVWKCTSEDCGKLFCRNCIVDSEERPKGSDNFLIFQYEFGCPSDKPLNLEELDKRMGKCNNQECNELYTFNDDPAMSSVMWIGIGEAGCNVVQACLEYLYKNKNVNLAAALMWNATKNRYLAVDCGPEIKNLNTRFFPKIRDDNGRAEERNYHTLWLTPTNDLHSCEGKLGKGKQIMDDFCIQFRERILELCRITDENGTRVPRFILVVNSTGGGLGSGATPIAIDTIRSIDTESIIFNLNILPFWDKGNNWYVNTVYSFAKAIQMGYQNYAQRNWGPNNNFINPHPLLVREEIIRELAETSKEFNIKWWEVNDDNDDAPALSLTLPEDIIAQIGEDSICLKCQHIEYTGDIVRCSLRHDNGNTDDDSFVRGIRIWQSLVNNAECTSFLAEKCFKRWWHLLDRNKDCFYNYVLTINELEDIYSSGGLKKYNYLNKTIEKLGTGLSVDDKINEILNLWVPGMFDCPSCGSWISIKSLTESSILHHIESIMREPYSRIIPLKEKFSGCMNPLCPWSVSNNLGELRYNAIDKRIKFIYFSNEHLSRNIEDVENVNGIINKIISITQCNLLLPLLYNTTREEHLHLIETNIIESILINDGLKHMLINRHDEEQIELWKKRLEAHLDEDKPEHLKAEQNRCLDQEEYCNQIDPISIILMSDSSHFLEGIDEEVSTQWFIPKTNNIEIGEHEHMTFYGPTAGIYPFLDVKSGLYHFTLVIHKLISGAHSLDTMISDINDHLDNLCVDGFNSFIVTLGHPVIFDDICLSLISGPTFIEILQTLAVFDTLFPQEYDQSFDKHSISGDVLLAARHSINQAALSIWGEDIRESITSEIWNDVYSSRYWMPTLSAELQNIIDNRFLLQELDISRISPELYELIQNQD